MLYKSLYEQRLSTNWLSIFCYVIRKRSLSLNQISSQNLIKNKTEAMPSDEKQKNGNSIVAMTYITTKD